MMVEFPDWCIDFMKNMPRQEEIDAKKDPHTYAIRDKNKNVLKWVRQAMYDCNGIACVAEMLICKTIVERAEQLGLITFDPETRTWQGVDYGGD